jgi:tripartite-type tricarboxylate transporter receptor subunit TctC
MASRRCIVAIARCHVLTAVMLAIAVTLSLPSSSQAQDYPTRPVKVIMPYEVGGIPDAVGRLIAAKLSAELGQPFIVENRTGAGGNIGVGIVVNSAADGYTLLLGATGTLTIGPSLYKQPPFKLADLAPVSLIGAFSYAMLSDPALNNKSLAEIVAMAKESPDKLKIASSGFGSESHLLIELFKLVSGAPLNHVPYKGFGLGVTDVIANRVDLVVASIPAAAPYVAGQKLHALAVTSHKRDDMLVGVPTFSELGYREMQMTSWIGLLAPAATPQPVLKKLAAAMDKIFQSPEVAQRMEQFGSSPMTRGPEAFADQLQADTKYWGAIIGRANIAQIE